MLGFSPQIGFGRTLTSFLVVIQRRSCVYITNVDLFLTYAVSKREFGVLTDIGVKLLCYRT